MSRFSSALMDHFQSPRNQRRMVEADAVGVAGIPGQGPFLALYLRIHEDRVSDVSFQCSGCGVTIACGSALTELICGRLVAECREITAMQLAEVLDGIPADKRHRAGFAIAALQDTVSQLESGRNASEGRNGLVPRT